MARPVQFLISVVISILVVFILIVPADTQDSVTSCVPEIKLRKNTFYTASIEHQLNISCPVTYCNETPVVEWIKIGDIGNMFVHIKETNQVTVTKEQTGLKEIISYLHFRNFVPDDSGIYRCKVTTSGFSLESHNININVSDPPGYTSINSTTAPEKEKETDDRRLLYVFIFLGTLGLVLFVMLFSFLCINQYSRNNHRRKNCPRPASTTTSGKSQEIPEEQNNIYDATTDELNSEQNSLCIENNQKCTAVMEQGNRNSSDGSEQIVYATLQHPTPSGPSAVRHQSRDQLSEYASIRIG
ncbi:B- and T-lymphocyte attenuator [Tachysurus fulvidraco]|uniref:B- and T-lymphocyte attenuator n=1 Tax=Tachysurus fulvidraco TaxID=1234273 RepID=UPI001FF069A0|nr:B- and T-lymphocyte attenuator [Tachysurus fulvidraco]